MDTAKSIRDEEELQTKFVESLTLHVHASIVEIILNCFPAVFWVAYISRKLFP